MITAENPCREVVLYCPPIYKENKNVGQILESLEEKGIENKIISFYPRKFYITEKRKERGIMVSYRETKHSPLRTKKVRNRQEIIVEGKLSTVIFDQFFTNEIFLFFPNGRNRVYELGVPSYFWKSLKKSKKRRK